MDVVSGIVHQLVDLTQLTTTVSNDMRHLVAVVTQLIELRSEDATSVAEVLVTVGLRSVSPGVVYNGPGRSATTDQTLRKLQEKDQEFTKYDGNPEHLCRGS